MEIIKINKEKVKIMLSQEDMLEYHINCEMLDGIDFRGREAFREILREAHDRCGFISSGKRIFVQIFPSKEGGCEMFVTRLNEIEAEGDIVNRKKNLTCYVFKNLNSLLACCKASLNNGYSSKSEAYLDADRKLYYLCLETDQQFACEYGGVKCGVNADAYIKEHCRNISKNAVEQLSFFIA